MIDIYVSAKNARVIMSENSFSNPLSDALKEIEALRERERLLNDDLRNAIDLNFELIQRVSELKVEHDTFYMDYCDANTKRLEVELAALKAQQGKPVAWVKQKIDWSNTKISLPFIGGTDTYQTHWIAWNCDEHTRGNPLPDGLVVEAYGLHRNVTKVMRVNSNTIVWSNITRFRIVGIQEGWE